MNECHGVVAAIPCQSNGVSGKVITATHYNTQFVILYNLCAFGRLQVIIITNYIENSL